MENDAAAANHGTQTATHQQRPGTLTSGHRLAPGKPFVPQGWHLSEHAQLQATKHTANKKQQQQQQQQQRKQQQLGRERQYAPAPGGRQGPCGPAPIERQRPCGIASAGRDGQHASASTGNKGQYGSAPAGWTQPSEMMIPRAGIFYCSSFCTTPGLPKHSEPAASAPLPAL